MIKNDKAECSSKSRGEANVEEYQNYICRMVKEIKCLKFLISISCFVKVKYDKEIND